MKKFISLMLALLMLFSFTACDEDSSKDKDDKGKDKDKDKTSQTDKIDEETEKEDTVIRGKIDTMDANSNFILAVKKDGTVVYTGGTDYTGNISLQYWENVIKVSVGSNHFAAISSDGKAYAAGYSKGNRCLVQEWTDIVDIYAGFEMTVGVKSDGTVISTAAQSAFEGWKDIVSLTGFGDNVYGLSKNGDVYVPNKKAPIASDVKSIHCNVSFALFIKNDGTVISDNPEYSRYYTGTENWTDVKDIAMSHYNLSAGLMEDGTVKLIGNESTVSQCDVSGWTDIVAIAVGDYHVVGLKSDGTVVATGTNGYGQCDVSEWNDIVAVWANNVVTIGLKENGKVVVTGRFMGEKNESAKWSGIKVN